MPSQTFTEAVAVGVVPLPHNRPKKITIEYTDGVDLVLKGESLRAWWNDYTTMWLTITKLQQTPTFSADEARERLRQNAARDKMVRDVVKEKLEKKGEDNNEE